MTSDRKHRNRRGTPLKAQTATNSDRNSSPPRQLPLIERNGCLDGHWNSENHSHCMKLINLPVRPPMLLTIPPTLPATFPADDVTRDRPWLAFSICPLAWSGCPALVVASVVALRTLARRRNMPVGSRVRRRATRDTVKGIVFGRRGLEGGAGRWDGWIGWCRRREIALILLGAFAKGLA